MTQIIVNARPHEINLKEVTYEQIIHMAFGYIEPSHMVHSVYVYSERVSDNPSLTCIATICHGDIMRIHEGIIFNVANAFMGYYHDQI